MDLLHNSIELIEQYMLIYGYWAVFFGVMLENAGLPVPGETILLIAGYFASTGNFNIALVMLIAAVGVGTGENFGFLVGDYFGLGFFLLVGSVVFFTPNRLGCAQRYILSLTTNHIHVHP